MNEFKTPMWGMSDDEKASFHKAALAVLAANGETPVGYRILTRSSGVNCTAGCLAPGSSAHQHSTLIGYELIGTTGVITVDAAMQATRSSSVHAFELADESEGVALD